MANWAFYKSLNGTKPAGTKDVEMAPSLTLATGDPCVIDSNGKVAKTGAQTDRPAFVATGAAVSTATGGETGNFLEIGRQQFIWKMPFTPLYNGVTAASGGSTTTVKLPNSPATYSTGDWIGGQVRCKETGEQRTITASDNPTAGNTLTLTVTQPFSKTTDGLTFSATPLGRKVTAGKLVTSTFDAPSQAIADLTGGNLQIEDGEGGGVDLLQNLVYCVVN